MIIRKITAENDWTFGHGLSNYATDEAAINENIQTRLLSWLNDCFFALQEGVDWRSRLDARQEQPLLDELKANILQSFGVVGINSVQSIFDSTTRSIRIVYDIQTIFSSSFQSQIIQASGAL